MVEQTAYIVRYEQYIAIIYSTMLPIHIVHISSIIVAIRFIAQVE
jgi:hypothetical protein